jgi:hypothetical protein
MTSLQSLKTLKTVLLVAGIAFTMACGYSHSMTPATAGNMPMIASLNPTDATHGMAVPSLVVSGTNFDGGSNAAFVTITFNGTSTKMMTNIGGTAAASTATTSIPMGFFTTTGTAQVTVTNPGTPGGIYGGGTKPETSAAMNFPIN